MIWTFGGEEEVTNEQKIKELLLEEIKVTKHPPLDYLCAERVLKVLVKDKPIPLNKLIKRTKIAPIEVSRSLKELQKRNVVAIDGDDVTLTDLHFYNKNVKEILDRMER